MPRRVSLVVNRTPLAATVGDVLLDAAMVGGQFIPHDCATGQCGTCRVRVYDGDVDDRGTRRGDTVLACQSRVAGPAVIEFDTVPEVVKRRGSLSDVRALAPDILEVTVTLDRPLEWLPGQYVKCIFAGFPSRDYSPTLRSDGSGGTDELILHVKRLRGGAVSGQLGVGIRPGHRVTIQGPFGGAFHRMGEGRIVLVAAGTGWAPIWAIARASRFRERGREMVVVVGVRDAANLYMAESLSWLKRTGVHAVFATATRRIRSGPGDTLLGRTTDYLPPLTADDTVYVAGPPDLAEAVESLCEAAGATCYADPFTAAPDTSFTGRGLGGKLLELFGAKR